MADTIDKLGSPPALTLADLRSKADVDFENWVADRKNRKIIGHRLEACGYMPVRNPDANDGLWKIDGQRQVIYAKTELPTRDQLAAAQQRQRQPNPVRWPERADLLILSGAR
jgi:hypothetical protein